MDIGVIRGVVMLKRVQDFARLLGGGSAIKVNERLAANALQEYGEIRTQFLQIGGR
jgi:hypothetical protein